MCKMGEGVRIERDWDLAAQAAPDYEVDVKPIYAIP